VILDVVCMKINAARSKIVSTVIATLISGLLVSIPVSIPAQANTNVCDPTSTIVDGATVLTFSDSGSCDWTVPAGVTSVRVLVVGGGGAGGGGVSGVYFGAGGGGGEVLDLNSVSVSTSVSVTVGAGGIKSAYSTTYTGANLVLRNGSNSSFGTNTARGGKAATNSTAAGGVSGNGNAGEGAAGGYWGNGGSGAGGKANAQFPGVGVFSNISGTSLEYGGGGDGNNNVGTVSPRGGAGTRGVEAEPNRGGGGSVMPDPPDNYGGGAGGSGVVIVSYTQTVVSEPIEAPANCRAGVGIGGVAGTTANQAGHGCVLIKYSLSNKTYFQSFNYTGSDQSWTSPSDVTSLTFYLLGAGGGADNVAGRGPGGSGGFATGTYAVSTPTAFTIIVGQGGNGNTPSLDTYGGGGKADYASGGGRSAIRLPNATEDLITAGGGGGGGYDAKCGGAGGGTTGQDAVVRTSNGEHGKGGTQTAGGAGGYSVNARTGGTGVKYQGGLGRDDSGGGGGGFWGGGGGGDNIGAGGGSGYSHPTLITNRSLVQGTCSTPGNSSVLRFTISYNGNNNTSGTAPTNTAVNTFTSTTLATNSGTLARTGYTFGGWNTRADGAGTTYTAGQTNFSPPGDVTLFALWNSTITYSANGATGTVPTAITTTTDASRTFNLNSGSGLTRTGLSFAGWNTASNGSGTYYAGGASYASTGTTTLFAIFRPLYTYNANGATSGTVPTPAFGPVPGTQCVTDPGFNNCRIISYTGTNQTFTIPSDIDATKGILVEAWGAGGGGTFAYYGDPSGGAGGYSKAKINSPTAGGVLTVIVGQGGLVRDTTTKFGGGGAAGTASGANLGSSGGGYSGVFSGSGTSTPIVISGGGGGGSPGTDSTGTPGGGGGANQSGGQSGTATAGGRGGSTSTGGAGATSNSCATAGSSLLGGTGCAISGAEGGGGGGGGYFGGGGGAYQTSTSGINGGGGGGSGFLNTTLATSVAAVKGPDGVYANFAYPDRTSPNYAFEAGRGGKPNTNIVADNTGGNGLITIQWSSPLTGAEVSENTGNLTRFGYVFAGWNTAADGSGTSVAAGSSFPGSVSTNLFAAWTPSNTGLTPSFNTNTNTPIGVLKSTAYTINNEYAGTNNDLILSQYADKIQIVASVPAGTLSITTTANLTLPIGYQTSLTTAASTISFIGNLADVNAALASLKYLAPTTAVITTVTITASYAGLNGDYRYNPATGSYYWRGATTVVRQAALDRTTASNNCGVSFNGMCGYMTIPNNADESLYIVQKLGIGWIGLSKPTHPTLQYVANAPSGLPTPPFTFWSSGEGGVSNEPNIGIRFTDGKWADLTTQSENPIYEFGGKSETPIFAPLTRTIVIAPNVTVTYVANGSNSGTVPSPLTGIGGNTLRAASNTGNLVKTGLTFAGWNTKADGTGITYLPNAEFTTATSISLFAMYLAACTPTRTTSGGFVILTFTGAGNCIWTTPGGVTSIDLLTVGAGGGGAGNLGGGGGGGQVVYQAGLAPIGTAVVTVGAGGAGGVGQYNVTTNHGNTGVRSGFVSSTLNQVALGGGGGKGRLNATNLNPDGTPISSGWTGGGAAYQDSAAQILPDPGVGGNDFLGGGGSPNGGGGGGGAGGVGIATNATNNAGAGGPGVSNSISGTATFYGGGGGTALYGTNAKWTGVGGVGGGANATRNGVGSAGGANTGGGGSSGYTQGGGAGGTGIVILRYSFGTPSAPVITSITGSANKLTVAFTAPTSDGGSAITNYEYSLDGGVTWTALSPTDTTSPIEITKLANGSTTLSNGTTYQVAIRALNGKTGLASNVVAGTTPLSPPTLSAVAGNAAATITVAAAAGESPTSFTVTAFDNSGVAISPAKTCIVTAPATSCVITGLANESTYKFSAVANLGDQSSTATTTSTGVTPTAPIVTYDANGGTVGASNTATLEVEFNAGTPVVHPLPVRAGYNFTGWYNSANALIGQNGSNYEPVATITLTAGWAGVTYSISYNGNGNTAGTVPVTGSYINGSVSAYTILGNTGSLAKTGYTFAGWVDGAGLSRSGNYSTAADLQLFASWTPVQFTVSFDSASGSISPANQLYTYGTAGFSLPSAGTRVGYTFLGWSRTATGTTVSSPFIADADLTLYARWSGSTFSVAFNSNGGSISPATAFFTTGNTGITLPTAGDLSGYTFAGWTEALNGNTLVTTPYSTSVNITLYAKWTAMSYNVTYNRGSIAGTPLTSLPATFPSNTTSTVSTVINLDNTITSEIDVSGTRYVFTGWKESVTNSVYKGNDPYRMSAAPVTFTAQWVAVYTVSYILNGGSVTAPAVIPPDETRIDTYVENLTNVVPARAGFIFAGWKDQAGNLVSAHPVPANTTFVVGATRYLLYAQWTPEVYTITYLPGAAGVTGTVTATTGNYRENVTLGLNSTLDYTNYKFIGWKIGTTIYSAGGNYVISANVNAEAQWESTLSQIFYDINGGTGAAAPSVATQNQAITLPLVGTFSRPGYSLAGWIGGGVTTPAATYTNTTTNSVTLIAQWTLLAPATPSAPTAVAGSGSATISVNPGSGGGPADSYVVTALDSSGNPLDPSKSCTVYIPSPSCVISGLEDGTPYKFATTATNSAGTSTSSGASTAVTPAGKPSIVTGVSATASNASAAVRFTAPASTGGAPIASYTVTASTGQTCVITPTFPNPLVCNFTNNLTNGTAVTFTVQANNGAYTSDTSTATIAVTPATVPGAPTGLTASSSAPGKATITFTAPTDNGGSAVTDYVVTSSPAGFTCVTANPSTGCEVIGLTNGTAYTFTAVARNSVGNSVNSTPSAAVTPVGKPSTPTNVVASAGNASATVSFTAPNNGGSAITRYDVEAYDQNGVPISPALTCTLNIPFPTPLACTFANSLANGLPYTFKVSATNVLGTSDSSTATSVITPANLIPTTLDQILTPIGETIVGELLTSSVQFGGFPTPTVTFVWERCTTAAATSCTTIAGANADTYTTTSADLGSFIRYKATGTNTGRTLIGTSATSDKITGNPVVATPTLGLSGTTGTAFTLDIAVTGGAEPFTYAVSSGTLPAGLVMDAATGTISGTPTAATTAVITVLVADTKGKTATTTFTISIAAGESIVTCNAACVAAEEAAARAARERATTEEAAARAARERAAERAAEKIRADATATAASNKASADAAAAAAAARAAIDKAAAAALSQAAADAAARTAAVQAKAAADAQAAAAKAAATAAAALRNSTTSAAAKAAATKSANTAAAAAATAVQAAATAAQKAAQAKTTAANASKQVDIAINSLNSKTAASQASAQANAIAAAAKAAANEAAAAAATRAAEARAAAVAAQKTAEETAARIATEQKEAAEAAAKAKIAADAAAKATAEKTAAIEAARIAAEAALKILNEKAALAEQAAKATTETARAEINKKIEEVSTRAEEAQKAVVETSTKADAAVAAQEIAVETAEDANEEAQTTAAEAVAVKAESVTKSAAATKAAAAATVAAKVATAAKEAAARVPSKAVITKKPAASTNKNSATATVSGLKPGQKVKVTVNVRPR
jgi:uncharacterized repeat protein (TIGR02543 family)